MPDHIYLSPHLDDAVFSCGGVIHQQVFGGEEVLVVTLCAGDPEAGVLSPFAQSLHERWEIQGPSVEKRREEDLRACARVGARALHLPFPEAIYRLGRDGTPNYASEEEIFGDLHPSEDELPEHIAGMLDEICFGDVPVYVPSGYGGHVDHELLGEAVSRLDINATFYMDFPYAIRGEEISEGYRIDAGEQVRIQLSDQDIWIWAVAVKEYSSQLSTFWEDIQTIEGELRRAHDKMGGIRFLTLK